MSGAIYERDRYKEEEREAEEKEDEAPELSEKERRIRDLRRKYDLDLGASYGARGYYNPAAALIVVILFVLLVYFGLTVAFFAMIFLLVDIACLGKVGGAVSYHKKARKYGFDDPEGTVIVKRLDLAQICFTLVLLAFAVEETLRPILNIRLTGNQEWMLWISWFLVISLVGAVFLSLIVKWRSYQSSKKFKETYQKILQRERRHVRPAYAS